MHYVKTVTLQRDSKGIAWSALVDLFRLTNLAGREGEKIKRAFDKSDIVCFAMDGSKLVGAARALTDFEYHATIYDIVVHPDYQGHSVGTRMMNELLSSLPVWRILLVADANVRQFYRRLGFEPFGDVLARLDRTKLYDPTWGDDAWPFCVKASDFSIRAVVASDAAGASALVQESFLKLASGAWESEAQQRFLADSGPEALGRKIDVAAYAAGAFCGKQVVGSLLMPTPTLLGMLFVRPRRLRRGIATTLWECVRTRLESQFPEARTVELNSTPAAVGFYRAQGFAPISAEFVRGGARATRMACWLPARALGAELRQRS